MPIKSKLRSALYKAVCLTFVFLITIPPINFAPPSPVKAQQPPNPKSNHLPQISVPALSGIKVNTWNGNLFLSNPLISIPSHGLSLETMLSYNSSWHNTKTNYGYGWQFNYHIFYLEKSNGDVVISWQDGRSQTFTKSGSSYVAPVDTYEKLTKYDSNKYKLVTKTGETLYFENSSHKNVTKIADTNGNSITFAYNGEKQLTQATDSVGRKLTFAYTSGKLSKITDNNTNPARTIDLTYDTNENLTQLKDPKGGLYKYEYNTDHFLTKITNPKNIATNIVYNNGIVVSIIGADNIGSYYNFDFSNRVTSVVDISNTGQHPITRYKYDAEGRINKIEQVYDAQGNVYTQNFVWDSKNNLTEYRDQNNNKTSYTYDSQGNILTITDALNKTTTYTYDPTFNKVLTIKDPANRTTSYQYDNKGNLLKIIDPNGNETLFSYDAQGKLINGTDARGKVSTYGYNSLGFKTSTTDPLQNSITYSYDNAGRLLTVTDPNSHTLGYQYDLNNNQTVLTNNVGNQTVTSYDELNRVTQVTDANGRTVQKVYDLRGLMIKSIDGAGKETNYEYDSLGNLTKLTDANGHITTFTYDLLGRKISEKDPTGHLTQYEYNAAGQLIKEFDPKGQTILYTYDANGRVTNINYPGSNDISYAYDNVGNLISESNADATITRTYDNLNRVGSVTTNIGTISKTISYEYDAVGNRTKLIDQDNGETLYTYDDANRLTAITNALGETTSYIYDGAGRLLEKQLANGTKTLYSYNNADQLVTLTNARSDESIISQYQYTYDSVGNKATAVINGDTFTYTYDNKNQLLTVSNSTGVIESYTYDNVGNRTKLIEGTQTTNYTYSADDSMLTAGSNSYTYDANGNLLTRTGAAQSYEYNPADQLIKVNLPGNKNNSFKYYSDGSRLSMTDQNGSLTYFLYDGDNILAELNADGTTRNTYTSNGVNGWISKNSPTESYFYYTDGIGSISNLTDGDEATVKSYSYNSYGKVIDHTGTLNNRFAYTGQVRDSDTGLFYYRARYYDPEVGRFTQKDPSGMVDGTNLYVYVQNNPLTYKDETGEFMLPALAVVAGLGAIYNIAAQAAEDLATGEKIGLNRETIARYSGAAVEGALQTTLAAIVVTSGPLGFLAVPGTVVAGVYAGEAVKQLINGKYEPLGWTEANYMALGEAATGGIVDRRIIRSRESISALVTRHSSTLKMINTRFANHTYNKLGIKSIVRYTADRVASLHADIINIGAKLIPAGQLRDGVITVNQEIKSNEGSKGGEYAKLGIVIGDQVYFIALPGQGGGGSTPPPYNPETTWKVQYFSDKNMNHLIDTKYESDYTFIDKDWGIGAAPPAGTDNFSIRWERNIYLDRSGEWEFLIRSDDGHRLYINGEKISDKWWDGSHDPSPTKTLSAGFHHVRFEYFESGGDARAELRWQRDYSGDDGVWLCTVTGWYEDHRENCYKVTEDIAKLSRTAIGNDKVKSITPVGPWEAVLYKDYEFAGDKEHFTGHKADLSTSPSIIKQNEASSVRVRRKDPVAFRMYDLGDYNGREFRGNKTLTNLSHWNFGDTAESIKISSGYEVIVCENSNFHGACGRSKGPKNHPDIREMNSQLRNSENQGRASSVRACEGTCPAWPNRATSIIPGNGIEYATGSTVNFQWFGNGQEFEVELSGGALTEPVYSGWKTSSQWSKAGLAASNNPYYWRVKSWNEFGEGSWSSSWSFTIKDVAIESVAISASDSGESDTDHTFNASVAPTAATTPITYTWSPTPKSGQGTAQAKYSWSEPGNKTVTVTASNGAGSKQTTKTFEVLCGGGRYFAQYYENGDLSGDPVSTGCEQKIDKSWEAPAGNYPDLIIESSDSVTINNEWALLQQNAQAGATELVTNSTDGFAVGDEIMIIAMKGEDAGKYEIAKIEEILSNGIKIESELHNDYDFEHPNYVQIVKVAIYNNVNIIGHLYANPYGTFGEGTGGVLAIKALGTFTNTGTVHMSGFGYRGGSANYDPNNYLNGGGESYNNEYGEISTHCWDGTELIDNSVGSGGGSGHNFYLEGDDTFFASGGGGGGHRFKGGEGDPGLDNLARCVGIGGNPHGNDAVTKLTMGGGGGAGGAGLDGLRPGSGGAPGGGIIYIHAKEIEINGPIQNMGAPGGTSGTPPTPENYGAQGGGGAGGTTYLKAETVSIGEDWVRVEGEPTYNSTVGTGSAGRIRIDYCDEFSGTAENITAQNEVDCSEVYVGQESSSQAYSARWRSIKTLPAGEYNLIGFPEGEMDVWINGEMVAENATEHFHNVHNLAEGSHTIVVEYKSPLVGNPAAKLQFFKAGDLTAPEVLPIPAQAVSFDQSFATFDLDNYLNDPNIGEVIEWQVENQNVLTVNVNSQNVVTVTKPPNWVGSEELSFIATDPEGLTGQISTTFTSVLTGIGDCAIGQYQAKYYNNKTLSGNPVITRCENQINYSWSGSPASGVNADNFSVVWEGRHQFVAGNYTFTTTSDDGVRLYLNGNRKINNWTDHGITDNTYTTDLGANYYIIKMEFYESGGGATAKLNWFKNVPLTGCDQPNKFCGQYYNNMEFSGTRSFAERVSSINKNWGTEPPVEGMGTSRFTIRWEGDFDLQAGNYTFTSVTDDGVKLWVNGSQIINSWSDGGLRTKTGSITIPTAGRYRIKMEYYDRTGEAIAKLTWDKTIPLSGCDEPNKFCGQYFNNQTFTAPRHTAERITNINKSWGTNPPVEGMGTSNFTIRWEGNFDLPAGNRTFTTVTDDGVRLWVNGSLIINNWTDGGLRTKTATINIPAAGRYPIKMEYYDRTGDARAKLTWN